MTTTNHDAQIMRRSLKHSKLASIARSTLALLDRVDPEIDHPVLANPNFRMGVESEYHSLLESLTINTPPTKLKGVSPCAMVPKSLTRLGITQATSYKEKRRIFGLGESRQEEHVNVLKFMQKLAEGAESSRKNNWTWRIAQEEIEMREQNWYPFFITLTLDPSLVDRDQFWRDPRHFKNYIRSIARTVARACGHPPPHKTTAAMPFVRPDSMYVRYAASLEHGASREHHHIHMILWCKEIPESWKKDPNIGYHKAEYKQCWPLKRYWKYGFSKPEYFRTKNDIWSDMGFIMPTTIRHVSTVGRAGAYLTKYMTKDHKLWKHRMRSTRGLGMTRLRNLLQKLPPPIVEALTWRPKEHHQHHSLSLIHSVPLGLVRLEAKRMHYCIQYRQALLDSTKEIRPRWKPFNEMLKSVQDGARPDRMDSDQFYVWLSSHLQEENGYCENLLEEAHKTLSVAFPHIRSNVRPEVLKAI